MRYLREILPRKQIEVLVIWSHFLRNIKKASLVTSWQSKVKNKNTNTPNVYSENLACGT